MLENIGLFSLMPTPASTLMNGKGGSEKNLEGVFNKQLNQLFYKELPVNTSDAFDIEAGLVSMLSPAQIITPPDTIFEQHAITLVPNQKLGGTVTSGSELPEGGNLLPALAEQIQALAQFTEVLRQQVSSQSEISGSPEATQIETALGELVQQLEQMVSSLTAAVEEVADAETQSMALPIDKTLFADVERVITELRKLTVSITPETTSQSAVAIAVPTGSTNQNNRAMVQSVKAQFDASLPLANESNPKVHAGLSQVSALLQVIVQRVQKAVVVAEQAVSGSFEASSKAASANASSMLQDTLLRSHFAVKAPAAQPLAIAQAPVLPVQSNALNALSNAISLGAAAGNSVHGDALQEITATSVVRAANAIAPAVAQAASANHAAGSQAGVEQTFNAQIGLPIENSRWADQFAQRVAWLAGQGLKSAQIHLNPAELGPLQVRIESHDDSAKVVFTTTHVSTRDNIESSLPRLRDLFASQGLDLLDVDVEQHNPNAQDQQPADNSAAENQAAELLEPGQLSVNETQQESIVQHTVKLHYGIIDAFA